MVPALPGTGTSEMDTNPEEASMDCAQVLSGGDHSSSPVQASQVCGQVPTCVDSFSSPAEQLPGRGEWLWDGGGSCLTDCIETLGDLV